MEEEKNVKRKLSLILFLALAAVFSLSSAGAEDTRIFDRADLFTRGEEQSLAEEIARFQEETGMDFVIVTSDEKHEDASQQQVADAFYDRGGFGLDEENSGILYYIDMYERWHYLSTTGKMIDYMTDERIASAIESCKGELSRGAYARAASRMISLVSGYVKKGIPEGQYRYDVVTGQRLTARHKALTSTEMLVCAAIAMAVGLGFVVVVRSRYKLKGETYRYDFRGNCRLEMTGREDTYLRTTTTRSRKPDPPQGGGGFQGGGFGGGGGGGSGVHTSGGTSHGGGGGRF